MDAQLMVDRRRLHTLLDTRPDWKLQDFADALGRSLSWVKKWVKRLRQATPDDQRVFADRSHVLTPTYN